MRVILAPMQRPHSPAEDADFDDSSFDGSFDPSFDAALDPALDAALEGEPRAHELTRMVETLLNRFHGLKADYQNEDDPTAKAKLKRELVKLREQILVLDEEARITEFVEGTVRAGLEMRKLEN